MEKYFFYLLATAIVACSNQDGSTKNNPGSTTESNAMAADSDIPSGDCGSLIFFKKGAIIEGATYDSAGKELSKETTTITDVTQENGVMVSHVRMDMHSSYGNHSMNVVYKCDGKSLYMDLGAFMSNLRALKGAKIEASSIQFPIHLSVGQSLPDASASVELDRPGIKMKTISTHADRKVDKIEKIVTPAGTWNCYRVLATIKTTTQMDNSEMQKKMEGMMKNNKSSQQMISWFAPDFGVVKTEMYLNNKLVSRSQLLSVKK